MPAQRKSRAIPLLPLWTFVACSRVNFTLLLPTFRDDLSIPYPWTEWILKMGPLGYPKTSVTNCPITMRIFPHRQNLNSRKLAIVAIYYIHVYIYIYIYIYIYTHTHTHTYIYIYIRSHIDSHSWYGIEISISQNLYWLCENIGARCWWRSWLRHCATSRKVAS